MKKINSASVILANNRYTGCPYIDLSDCGLKEIPPELGGYDWLVGIDFHNNEIQDLAAISKLFNLQWLDLSNNDVHSLETLADLKGLRNLNISNTRVTDLKPIVALIKKGLPIWSQELAGDGIYVSECRLSSPPRELVDQGNDAVLNYFLEKEKQGVDKLYEAKLLIVGEGGTGKTSLLRRLYQSDKPLPNENESTRGIEIHRHLFKTTDDRVFRLNVWDFGGQEIYHSTHKFFLTSRSLYVLLDDTKTNYKTVYDHGFKYWLEAVELFGGASPILIFQNEKGGRSKSIDISGIRSRFPTVKDVFCGDLLDENSVVKLKRALEYYAENLSHIGQELPAKWISIRSEIEEIAKTTPFVSQSKYFEIYSNHLVFDKEKALLLSSYLHDLGVFLHFQNDALLSRTVILQNEWATEAVFRVLDDNTINHKIGRFDDSDCSRIWEGSIYSDMKPELLALMGKFELCYRLHNTIDDIWLAPQLLPASKPNYIQNWYRPGDLILRYKFDFLPKGLINRLMVRQHRFVPDPEKSWSTGVLFEYENTILVAEIEPNGNEIVLRSRGPERRELLCVISADLDALNDYLFNNVQRQVEKFVPCNCEVCVKSAEPENFKQTMLLRRKYDNKLIFECPSSYKYVNVLDVLEGVQISSMPVWATELPKLFVSYSRKDKKYLEEFIKHLSSLQGKAVTWNDSDIQPGEEWDKRIRSEISKADVVLYLVTANSLSTQYIQDTELPLIEARCASNDCILIPVIVDFCCWSDQRFAKYGVLPEKGKPVTDAKHWVNENQAWKEVVDGVRRIVENLMKERLEESKKVQFSRNNVGMRGEMQRQIEGRYDELNKDDHQLNE